MLNQPFFQVALPIMATMIVSVWAAISTNNRRLEELSKRFDDGLAAVNRRLDDFGARLNDFAARLDGFAARLGRIEERLTAVERKVDALELKAWR